MVNDNTLKKTVRWESFDILKLICAFLVVCIHCFYYNDNTEIYGKIGEIVIVFAQVAVPIFFMISGYFYFNTVKRNRQTKQIKKILYLCIEANVIFFLLEIVRNLVDGKLATYLQSLLSAKLWTEFIFFNDSPFANHLWYLTAILYVLIIVYFFQKFRVMKILYIATPFLLFANMIFGTYSVVIFNQTFRLNHTRNFLLEGLPFFCIGILLYKYKDKIISFFIHKKLLLFMLVLLSTAMMYTEWSLIEVCGKAAIRQRYIGTILLIIFGFVLFMVIRVKRPAVKNFSKLGLLYATQIYILHPMILIGVYKVCTIKASMMIAPLLTFVVTLLFVAMIKALATVFKKTTQKTPPN